MLRLILASFIFINFSVSGIAQISKTFFLQCPEPAVMCQSYLDNTYGSGTTTFINPRGGAMLRMQDGSRGDYCITIFCDCSFHGLVIFHFNERGAGRMPKKMSSYGLPHYQMVESDTLRIPLKNLSETAADFEYYFPRFDSIGQFNQPVDVAIGASGDYYNPDSDIVYIVDQANCRIVRLKYDKNLDSLVWVGTFGEDILRFPTAIAYADYGSLNRIDHDVYVTDAANAKLYRFSASGIFESDYGGFGYGLSFLGYPTGVAIYPGSNGESNIYVSDSYNHNISKYLSNSSGEIEVEKQFIFPHIPIAFIAAVDIDSWGNVYVVDSYNDKITVLDGDIKRILDEFGTRESSLDHLESPIDIRINKQRSSNEIIICEW